MDRTHNVTGNPVRDDQLMLKAIKFASLLNECAFYYRNWKDAEKTFDQASDEYNRGKSQFQNFPVLKERLENKKSIAEEILSKTRSTHDIKAKTLAECCRDLLSDRLDIRETEDIIITARDIIRGKDSQIDEQRLLDQCKSYFDTALAREQSTPQVDLSEIHTELQRLRAVTERQDATIKEQQNTIEEITKKQSELRASVHDEVDTMHDTINIAGMKMVQSATFLSEEMHRLENLITTLQGEKRPELPVLEQEQQTQQEQQKDTTEQISQMGTNYKAVLTSLVHLNKRIDDFSIDNIVCKINMQLRNVRDEHLQTLMTDLRRLKEFIGIVDAAGNIIRPLEPLTPGTRLSLIEVKQEIEQLRSSLHQMNQAWGQRADDINNQLSMMGPRV